MSKKVDDRFFYSTERKNKFKSKGFVKRTVNCFWVVNVENM